MVVLPLESLPLGFRFHPTDEELINHYLKGKIGGRKPQVEVIPEIDVCKCEPWDLPAKSLIRTGDPEWFFFASRDRKYPNGHRSNRATEAGYWKATGKDRKIKSRLAGTVLIGMKKTLVFYRGRAPKGERTCWIMHEYRTVDVEMDGADNDQGAYVLCRLFKKTEERTSRLEFDKIDEYSLPPLPPKVSAGDTQLTAGDESEKDITHEVNMHEMRRDETFPDGIIEKQPYVVDSWLTDGLNHGTCPPKTEDSYSNSNIASDAADVEIELVNMQDDILGTLNRVDTNYYPHVSSPIPLVEVPFYVGLNDQLGLHYVDGTDQDDITEFLDSVLSNQDEDFFGSSSDQFDQTVANGDVLMCNEDYDRLVDVNRQQVTDNGGQQHLVQSNLAGNFLSYQLLEESKDSVDHLEQISTLDYRNHGVSFCYPSSDASVEVYSPDSFQGLCDTPETPISINVNASNNDGVENGLVGSGIQIRPGRQRNTSSTSPMQGTAIRRIRLQREIRVGSSVCSGSSIMKEGHGVSATCNKDMENDELREVEESTGSVCVGEMRNSDQGEHISAEGDHESKDEVSAPVLRLRKTSCNPQNEETTLSRSALLKSTTVRGSSLQTYLAAGAVVVAFFAGMSIYFGFW